MPVHATGPRSSPLIALVGEAPGQDEVRVGIPFVGAAGKCLNQMLASAGIVRSECFITNVVNTRPMNNDFSVFYEGKGKHKCPTTELCNQRKRMWDELEEVKPKMIIALGNEALKALTMEDGISNWRGTVWEKPFQWGDQPLRVLPTLHPSYINRMYHEKGIVEADLKKALRQARTPYRPKVRFRTKCSFDEIMDFLDNFPPLCAFDIETFGQYTRRFGFAWSDLDAISIPLIENGHSKWSEDEEDLIVRKLNTQLSDPEKKKYIQNFPFDCTVIAREFGIHTEGILLDTMFAWHTLYPEFPKGLDFISSIVTDFPMYWGKDRHGGDEANAVYNCYDCCATYIAGEGIQKELKERGLWDFYNTIIHPVIFGLTRMQSRGILTNQEIRPQLRANYQSKLDTAYQELKAFAGEEVNPNSPNQIKSLVYGKWGLPVVKVKKKITVDDDALKALARKSSHYEKPLRAIISCRQARKAISTYVDMTLSPDNRMRTSYNLAGAVSGRWASSATIDGEGGNLQNILRGEFRRYFIADPGKVLIKADLSQAEFRIVCWLAQIWEMINEYKKNPLFDVHTLNASRVWSIAKEAVTKKQRDDSKNGVYGYNYGMTPIKASKTYDIELEIAKRVHREYHTFRPEIKIWWKKVQDLLIATRTLKNPFGRIRIFAGRVDDQMFRDAYSWLCQSTVADLINIAFSRLDNLPDETVQPIGFEPLLQVHDELLTQVNETNLRQGCKIVQDAMFVPINIEGVDEPLVIPVEIKVGRNWFDTLSIEKWEEQNATVLQGCPSVPQEVQPCSPNPA